MAKSHCMSRHAARECSRGRAKKNGDWARRDDQAADVVEGEAFPFLSMTYLWNVSCLVVGLGWGKLTLVWYVELTSQTAGEEVIFFHRWAACSSTRSTGRLGTTATFLLFPKPKKIMPQFRTTSLATSTGRDCSKTCRKSFVWHWQSKSYPDQFRCPPNAIEVKELCFV